MRKKLVAIGNSLGLIIEQPILELLRIDRETILEISTDGKTLIIRPVSKIRRAKVRRSARKLMAVHDKTLRKLAE